MKDDSVTPLGLSPEALEPVMVSYVRAKAQLMNEDLSDPMKASFGLIHNEIPASFHHMIQAKVGEQVIRENGSGLRFDRMKMRANEIRSAYLRKLWIIECWVSFRSIREEITDYHLSEIGIAYLTDETASALIEHMFPECGDFTTKHYENFRKRYGLAQVPLAYRHKGIMVNGELKITHVGRKKV